LLLRAVLDRGDEAERSDDVGGARVCAGEDLAERVVPDVSSGALDVVDAITDPVGDAVEWA
jgi:hypothetical protein